MMFCGTARYSLRFGFQLIFSSSRQTLKPNTSKLLHSTSIVAGKETKNYWWRDWDGSIEPGDATDEAFENLDVTKLMPHPEWRNVAAGPVWSLHDDPYEMIWKENKDRILTIMENHDKAWDKYIKENNYTPQEYFNSQDYKMKYDESLIWETYQRNFKGGIQPQVTRRTCRKKGKLQGNPCPICRDTKVLISYKNVNLLKQFIDPYSYETYVSLQTGLCRHRQGQLERAISIAKQYGYLPITKTDIKHEPEKYNVDHPSL